MSEKLKIKGERDIIKVLEIFDIVNLKCMIVNSVILLIFLINEILNDDIIFILVMNGN